MDWACLLEKRRFPWLAIALMTLACLVVKHCGKELLDKGQAALGK